MTSVNVTTTKNTVTVNGETRVVTVKTQGTQGPIVSDGDKGDITVASNGTAITINTGAVTSAKILDGTIVDADINASAAIALSKLATGTLPSGLKVNHNNLQTGIIEDENISSSAAIQGTKINTNFGSQNITTTGNLNAKDIVLTDTAPLITFNDSDHENDFVIGNLNGTFIIQDADVPVNRFTVATGGQTTISGNLDCASGVDVTGNITVTGTVDGVDIATRDTLFGGLTSSSGVLTDGVTATTQAQSDNSTKVSTTAYVRTAVSNLVNSAPSTLDTLKELSDALGADANFSTTITNSIATKMPLAGGEFTGNITTHDVIPDSNAFRNIGTSSVKFNQVHATTFHGSGANLTNLPSQTDNNFTDADHSKLDGIESGATADQTASDIKTLLNSSGLVNAQIDASAAIQGTKISPDFGSQTIATTGNTNLTGELRANGNIRMTNSGPKVSFIDAEDNPDFEIGNLNGLFRIRDITNSANRLTIGSDSNIQIPADNAKLQLGASQDLELYHDSSNSIINNTTGILRVRSDHLLLSKENNSRYLQGNAGVVELFFDNNKKFETTSTGTKISGSENIENSVNALSDLSVASNYHLHLSNPENDVGEAVGLSFGLSTGGDIGASIYHTRLGTNSYGDLMFATKASGGSVTERLKITSDGNVHIPADSARLQIGANQDLDLFHHGSNSLITNKTGTLLIHSDNLDLRPNTNSGEVYLRCTQNGSVELRFDSVKKFETTAAGISVTGRSTFGGSLVMGADNSYDIGTGAARVRSMFMYQTLDFLDNGKIQMGNLDDLQIYHDGTNSNIVNSTGNLHINADALLLKNAANSESYIRAYNNLQVELYYDNSLKLQTTSTGISVSSSSDTILRVTSADGSGAFLDLGDISDPDGGRIGYDNGSNLIFNTASSERMRINSSGNVGIGTFAPSTSLHINNSGSSTQMRIENGNADFLIQAGDAGDDGLHFYDLDNSAYRMMIANSGNVGIGTITPTAKLDVAGNIAVSGGLTCGGAIFSGAVNIPDNYLFSLGSSNDLQLFHNGSNSYISNRGAGAFVLEADTGENGIVLAQNGSVDLYYDNAKKLETTSTGIEVANTAADINIKSSTSSNSGGGQITFENVDGNGQPRDVVRIKGDTSGNGGYGELTLQTAFNNTLNDRLVIKKDGNVQIPTDNVKLQIGASQDLELYHSGSHSFIDRKAGGTGDIYVRLGTDNAIIAKTDAAVELYFDHNKKFETHSTGSNITGSLGINTNTPASTIDARAVSGATITARNTGTAASIAMSVGSSTNQLVSRGVNSSTARDLLFMQGNTTAAKIDTSNNFLITNDNAKLQIGASQDLFLEHDGNNSVFRNATGDLYIQDNSAGNIYIQPVNNEGSINAFANDRVELAFDGSTKLQTTSTGAFVTGRLDIGNSSWAYPKTLNVQGSSGSILALRNNDTTSYAADTNTSIELSLNTGNTGNQTGACEIRAFKENGTNGNNARGLSFYTGVNGGSPNERLRITSDGNVRILSADATINGVTVGKGANSVSTNTAIGVNALNGSVTAENTTAIGNNAGTSITSGSSNTLIGSEAGQAITTGNTNVGIGRQALYSNVGGDRNIAIGHNALYTFNPSGDNVDTYNTAVGHFGLKDCTTGTNNTAIGGLALQANTTGQRNVAIGSGALDANTTASDNTAVGMNSLTANTTGNSVVGFGAAALAQNTTGDNNTAVGKAALYSNTTADHNTACGKDALFQNTTGASLVAVGSNALANNTTANYNNGFGAYTLYNNTTGTNNVAVGHAALISNTTASNNTGLGFNALLENENGTENVAIGAYAADAGTNISNTVAVGYNALTNTTNNHNTAVGSKALEDTTSGSSNVAVGSLALTDNITGTSNVAVGMSALRYGTAGSNNAAVGGSALQNNTASNNTAVGFQSLKENTTGANNVAVGMSALDSNTSGAGNTVIGYGAGTDITTGENNLCLGQQAGNTASPSGSLSTSSNNIVLGNNSITNAFIKVAFTVTSDKRDKIEDGVVSHGLDFVNQLKPKSFWFRKNRDSDEKHGDKRYGFYAQDILALEGSNAVVIDNKDPENLKYKGDQLIPILVKAIQELTIEVNKLKSNG